VATRRGDELVGEHAVEHQLTVIAGLNDYGKPS